MANQKLEEILDILACPDCKSPVKLFASMILCTNKNCRRSYKVNEDGVPILLIDQSRIETPEAWGVRMDT